MDTFSAPQDKQKELSQYVLLLLSDSNLPTGGFIASAGLESYIVHGLLSQCAQELYDDGNAAGSSSSRGTASVAQTCSALLSFLSSSLDSYARASVPFLADTHRLARRLLKIEDAEAQTAEDRQRRDGVVEDFVRSFSRLDDAYHSMILNHVARRASCAQGIAFLTLYSKAFSKAPELAADIAASLRSQRVTASSPLRSADIGRAKEHVGIRQSVDALKLSIRRGSTPGHLPLCFGLVAAALGLQLRPAIHLHLFLQARALLSTAIRLNIMGPYLAHQMLLSHVREAVDATMMAVLGEYAVADDNDDEDGHAPTTGLATGGSSSSDASKPSDRTGLRPQDVPVRDEDAAQGWAWDWSDDGAWGAGISLKDAPTTTWPLGEIVQARHDQLQSRLFNS